MNHSGEKVLIKSLTQAKPEKVFLIFGSFFGILMVFIIAPFQVPDENQHFYRAYAISSGNFFSSQGWEPVSFVELRDFILPLPFHPENRVSLSQQIGYLHKPLRENELSLVAFANVSVYSPVPYFPQAAGILVGRILRFSPLVILYLARLLNFLVWLYFGFSAVRMTPIFKWLTLFLLLTPMNLSQAASASADCFTNAVAFLAVAVYLDTALDKENHVSPFRMALLLGLTVLLALTKPPYVFITGLFLIVPIRKFLSKRRWLVSLIVQSGVMLLMFVFAIFIGKDEYQTLRPRVDLAPFQQLSFVVEHPGNYLKVCLNTLEERGLIVIRQYIGILGWADTVLPAGVYMAFLIILPLVIFLDASPNFKLTVPQRLWLVLIPGWMLFVILTALYLTWTPYKARLIDGLQGRYLIPLIPPLLVVFQHRKTIFARGLPVILLVYIPVILTITLRTLVSRWYVI